MATRAQGRSQIDLFHLFDPLPTQRRFIQSPAKYRLLSSGYGGGKSKLGCRESIRMAVDFPGSRNLVARLSATDLRDTTMVTFWREMREIGFRVPDNYTYNKADREITWWNKSTTIFRHLEEGETLGSLELSSAFIDEGSEVPDGVYTVLFPARLRWHLPGCTYSARLGQLVSAGQDPGDLRCPCPRRAWVCTNPGASGYLLAVTRGEMPTSGSGTWEWFPVRPGENPFNGPDYYREMAELRAKYGDVWFKRFYEGDWSAFEGQRFTGFSRERHILANAWAPGPEHEIIEGWDFGHRETFVSWLAHNPHAAEPIVVFDELQVREVDEPGVVGAAVKEIRERYGLGRRLRALGDPAGVAASQFSSVSPIQAYGSLGLHITPCVIGKSPTDRADRLSAHLAASVRMPDGSQWPGIVFGPNCVATVSSVSNLRWRPQTSRLGEDPREQFLKRDDHGFDALSYALVGVPPARTPVLREKLPAWVNVSPGSSAWQATQPAREWVDR